MDHTALQSNIEAYISGDDAAGDRVCATLDTAVRLAVYGFLSPGDADRDDIVQDTLLAMLDYLRRAKERPDNPEAFAVTVAQNRCRNLFHWRRLRETVDIDDMAGRLPDTGTSPLELLVAKETRDLLAEALEALDPSCRRLLRRIYMEECAFEDLRRELGLGSVQAVYHRKNICFAKVTKFFNRRRFGGRYIRKQTG